MTIITSPGAYAGIAIDDYHGPEICPAPSISSSGLKLIDGCPLKYWHQSPLNPDRQPRKSTPALNMGKAVHDVLEHGRLGDGFHIVPNGFSAAHTSKWSAEMPAYLEAVEAGKLVLRQAEADAAHRMIDVMRRHDLADALFTSGQPEMTLAWQDRETGVWLRSRPDWLPTARAHIPDYKSASDASPDAFSRSLDSFGYHASAALYLDGIEAIFGERPRSFIFVVQEKEPPHVVQLYQLDEAARSWGAALNRRAIRRFADCLSSDRWPGYGGDIEPVDLPTWRRRDLEAQAEAGLLEYHA